MKPDFERSASLAQRVKDAYTETKVVPHWFGNGCFWYLKKTIPKGHSFLLVDAKDGSRHAAFDHERLATALNENGSFDTHAITLPFTYIDPSDDGDTVRFRTGGKKWQFKKDGSLSKYDGDIHEETLTPLRKERPSVDEPTAATAITFVNQTKQTLSLYWIDWAGNLKHYIDVEAGQSNRRPTYTGHVWRVTNIDIKTAIASFVARDEESVANIEAHMDSVTEPFDESKDASAVGCDDLTPKDESQEDEAQMSMKVFIRDYNVWVHDTDGAESQISSAGTTENPFDDTIHQSPDGKYAVMNQCTAGAERILYHIESSPKDQLQPRLKQTSYLKPGDKRRIDRPRMFDLSTKKEVDTDDSLFSNPYSLRDLSWSNDSTEFRFIYNQRGHQVIRLVGINIDGSTRNIIEDTSATFIDYSNKTYCYETYEDTKELIWASERDGWNHLYLYDIPPGKLKNQITKGEWIVRSVEHVDEEGRQVYFKALGLIEDQDPYYAHLVRINFDGSDLTILTQGNSTHSWKWSPDKKYLVDTWSRVNQPPTTVLINASNGSQITTLESNNIDPLLSTGWSLPEPFSAPGRDGKTPIYGLITIPSTLSPSKKYPIIECIYAGPQSFSVPKSFSTQIPTHELAELGFIVVQIDGMGTNWRHKAFHDICYKNLSDAGLPDRIAWMKAAAATRPWMDLERVGICGGSAGGANALAALLHHGDFYKAAVADCGCHDPRFDKLWWNEAWMGYPVDASYAENSNASHVRKLRGRLLLMVGELDDNVDPSSTLQVVSKLNEAGKDYEFLYVPGVGHGVREQSGYARRRERDFFVRWLMGVEPPDRNQ